MEHGARVVAPRGRGPRAVSASPRHWSTIKALFQQAIDLEPDAREAFLAQASGADAELRAEVESLLAAHDDERPFLDAPVAGAARVLGAALDEAKAPAGLTPGTKIGQYEVLEPIGSGGMGNVYRARDTRLDRFVALKIVIDTAVGGTADRVLREARAASALNHPNICTLYEAGEFEGQPYLAMEYIAGQPLSALIPSGGFAPPDVVGYGMQIADALAHAHEHGVIHRDLKSANVVVMPEGRAKVLDFGIARRVATVGASTSSATLTDAGTISGTLACMAPELLRDQPADARSDIWALGVLLYELAAGRRPFAGDTAFELTLAILKDAPPPLPANVPADLRALIFRCLARDPSDRFQQASDVVAALEESDRPVRAGSLLPGGPTRRVAIGLSVAALLVAGLAMFPRRSDAPVVRLAVLPFNVLSGAQEIGFLGIGVPDTIISRIAAVKNLRVRALLSPGKERSDPQEIGRELGVNHVLSGTIQKAGDQMRITPQLIRVDDGVAIWTRPYTLSTTSDLFRVQDEIARGVMEALQVQVTSEERGRAWRHHTQDPEAYALYVRGRAELAPNARASVEAAVKSFEAALARDRQYVLAHAGLAMASAKMRLFFAAEHEVSSWYARAHEAAQQALTLDPDVAETHEALAAVHRSTDFNWPQTIQEATRALDLNPNLDQPHLYLASAFMHLGLLERAAAEAKRAVDLNPANADEPLRVQGAMAMYGGRFDEAMRLLDQAAAARGAAAEWNQAYAYYNAGLKDKAESMLRKISSESARSKRRAQATLAGVLAARGERAEAETLIEAVLDGSYKDHHVAYALGAAYAQLGMPKEALERLTEARSTGFECLPWFERDPLLAPLKSTAAFQRFLDEFRQSWATQQARFPTGT
jgi:eukaryotic-like serine/threonine-protein kinase